MSEVKKVRGFKDEGLVSEVQFTELELQLQELEKKIQDFEKRINYIEYHSHKKKEYR